MIAILQFFVEFINAIITYVVNFFGSLIDFFGLILTAVVFALSLPSYVPAIIGSSVIVVIVIGVIKLIPYGGNNQ